MRPDETILFDIVAAGRRIAEFTVGFDEKSFIRDVRTQSAVLHQLMIIGEAVGRLSPDFRMRHPHIPWRLILGMRNKLIHEYEGVDLIEVWNTALRDVPQLLARIEALLPEEM